MSNSDRDPQGTNAGVCQRYVLGVDGGGTKTEAWLANCGVGLLPARLGVGTGGPSNPHAVGLEAAQQNILATVQAAFSVAQVKPHPVAAACLALAGVGRESIREAMQAWSQSVGFAERVQVVHDAQAVLHAGADTGCGVALISGTGSFAYGETSLGRVARSGGWGYLWGDEGSGFALGRSVLQAVARASDGRGPDTLLTPLVLERYRLRQSTELIPTIYDAASPRGDRCVGPLPSAAGPTTRSRRSANLRCGHRRPVPARYVDHPATSFFRWAVLAGFGRRSPHR